MSLPWVSVASYTSKFSVLWMATIWSFFAKWMTSFLEQMRPNCDYQSSKTPETRRSRHYTYCSRCPSWKYHSSSQQEVCLQLPYRKALRFIGWNVSHERGRLMGALFPFWQWHQSWHLFTNFEHIWFFTSFLQENNSWFERPFFRNALNKAFQILFHFNRLFQHWPQRRSHRLYFFQNFINVQDLTTSCLERVPMRLGIDLKKPRR